MPSLIQSSPPSQPFLVWRQEEQALYFQSFESLLGFLGIQPPFKACIGHAPHARSQNNHCSLHTSEANRGRAGRLSNELLGTCATSRRAETILKELSTCVLCGRYHQEMATTILDTWMERLRHGFLQADGLSPEHPHAPTSMVTVHREDSNNPHTELTAPPFDTPTQSAADVSTTSPEECSAETGETNTDSAGPVSDEAGTSFADSSTDSTVSLDESSSSLDAQDAPSPDTSVDDDSQIHALSTGPETHDEHIGDDNKNIPEQLETPQCEAEAGSISNADVAAAFSDESDGFGDDTPEISDDHHAATAPIIAHEFDTGLPESSNAHPDEQVTPSSSAPDEQATPSSNAHPDEQASPVYAAPDAVPSMEPFEFSLYNQEKSPDGQLTKQLEQIKKAKYLGPGWIYAFCRESQPHFLKIGSVRGTTGANSAEPVGSRTRSKTVHPVTERLLVWKQCVPDLKLVFVVPIACAVERIERLVHRTLQCCRYEYTCSICKREKRTLTIEDDESSEESFEETSEETYEGTFGETFEETTELVALITREMTKSKAQAARRRRQQTAKQHLSEQQMKRHIEWFNTEEAQARDVVESWRIFATTMPYQPDGTLKDFWMTKVEETKAELKMCDTVWTWLKAVKELATEHREENLELPAEPPASLVVFLIVVFSLSTGLCFTL